MLILNKYVRRFIDVPLLFICFFCRGRTMSWKKFCAIWREQLEVHNSLSVEMKSATLGCGQLSLVAGRGLRRHLCKCQAFVCTWGGFTWLLVTLPPPPCPPLSPLSISTHPLPPSPCIPPVTGLTDTRHQQVLWPRWIRFPTCQEIVLHAHFYGLVLHSWRFSVHLWCAAMSDNH